MPKRTFKTRVWPASGGLDQSSIPGTEENFKLAECDNIIFTVNGSRKKRWGIERYSQENTFPVETKNFRGGIDFWRNVDSVQTQKVVSFVGGKLYADNNDGSFNDITGTTSLVTDDQVSFEIYVGLLIAFFENAVPQRWNMTDATFVDLGGTPPPASFGRVHEGRVWAAGNKAAPHRLYYSAPDNPEDWTLGGGGGSIDIDLGDSDPIGITAIFPSFHGDLYVAKRRSLYRVRTLRSSDLGTSLFSVEPVVKGIGCIAHNSVVAIPNDVLWASERGVHSLIATDKYGDVASTFLSYPIHELFRDRVNFNRSKNMWAVYSPEMNSYLLAYTRRGKSTNFDILAYNIEIGQWYRHQDIDCAALFPFVDSRFKSRIMIASESLDMGVFDESLVSDYGVSYDCFFTTPVIYPLGPPDISCNFKRLWLFVRPQSAGVIDVTYKIDGKNSRTVQADQTGTGSSFIGTAVIGEDIIGGTGEIKKIAVPLLGEGSGIQFTFTQSPESTDTGEDMDIYGYVIEGEYVEDSAISTVT